MSIHRFSRIHLSWTALLLFLAAGRAIARDFTIEQVLRSPFPSSLTAAQEGERIAWIFNEQGRRNVWVAEGPRFDVARRLTDWEKDDGRALSQLRFSSDGSYLVFVRDNRFNPTDRPRKKGGFEICETAWATGRTLAFASNSPVIAVSKTRNEIATVSGSTVWIAPVPTASSDRKKLTVLGEVSELEWSPNGSRLALTVSRGRGRDRSSFVALYDRTEGRLRSVDTSYLSASLPRWSPDGKRIAFLSKLRSAPPFVLTARKFPLPDPWEIRIFDLGSRETSTCWKSADEESSVYADFRWWNNDRILFGSERNGWRHLYSIRPDGQDLQTITSGGFEAETFSTHPKHSTAFWVSNQDDIDRRHIWSMDPDGRGALTRPLTTGPSSQWSPCLTGDGRYVAYLSAGAIRPAHVCVIPVGGGKEKTVAPESLPKDFPLDSLVRPEPVLLISRDHLLIHAQLFQPRKRSHSAKRPALLYFHGGPIRQMLLGWHYSSYYHHAYAMIQYLTSRGYLVLSVNYRLGIGYGRVFRDVSDGGPRGASEYQDLLAGADYLRSRSDVDPRRIGLFGGSYGGYLTAMGLARNSNLFAAGVDLHGVHDWDKWQAWVEGRPPDHNRLAWLSSPASSLDTWKSPVLLIHGNDDRNVPISQTMWLVRELKNRDVPYELLVLPGEVHDFLRHQSWIRAFQASARFLDRHLRAQ